MASARSRPNNDPFFDIVAGPGACLVAHCTRQCHLWVPQLLSFAVNSLLGTHVLLLLYC